MSLFTAVRLPTKYFNRLCPPFPTVISANADAGLIVCKLKGGYKIRLLTGYDLKHLSSLNF